MRGLFAMDDSFHSKILFKSFKPFKTFKLFDRTRNDLNDWNCWDVLNHVGITDNLVHENIS